MRSATLVTALLASTAFAQTVIIPAAAEGNSSQAAPFDVANSRLISVYDSTHFTTNGINFPIVITRMKVRANGGTTWAGGTSQLQLDLSTAPVDYLSISTTFNNNHGQDRLTVFSGPQTSTANAVASTPSPFLQDILFQVPFVYYPIAGDLAVDFLSTGVTIASMPAQDLVTTAGVAKGKRVSTTVVANTTGTVASGESAHVVEFDYVPAIGMYPAFTVNTTSGASPLNVNFTDQSFTTTPGGITNWAWDFNGDAVVDSSLQNPAFVYNACGDYSVTLTVTDGSGSAGLTKTGYIHVDNDVLTPTFTTLPLGPTTMQFTDTTTPTPTSWDWDFNGDNITDASGPVAVWAFPAACTGANVKLTVNRLCRGPFSATKGVVVGAQVADVSPAFNLGTQASPWVGLFLDITVHNPLGLSVCAATINTYAFDGPYSLRMYLTPNTYVGKDGNIAEWRLLGEGSGATNAEGTTGAPDTSIALLNTPMYLPPGNHGLAVFIGQPAGNAGISYSTSSQGTTGNADISFYPNPVTAPGISRLGLFSGGSFGPPRVWNGELHYTTCALSGAPGYSFFGPGCAGTMPVSTNVGTAPPRLGQNMVAQFDNVAFSAGLMLLGFSRTTSPFGPLPLDLTPLGMPGCFGRVSPDLSYFYLGAGNAVTATLFIPADPVFLCLPIYTQLFVFDTVNAFGGVMSDAAAAIIGS